MPFNIIKLLCEQFNQTYGSINRSEIPEQVRESFDDFKKIVDLLKAAQSATEKLANDGKPLSKEDAGKTATLFNDIVDKAETFLKDRENDVSYEMFMPVPVVDLFTVARDQFKVVKAQANILSEAAKPENNGGMPSMNDVMSDYSWVENVFAEDPDIENYKKKSEVIWNRNEHSTKENIEKYKEEHSKLHDKFGNHMRKITGESVDYMAAFENKLDLIQLAMNAAAGKYANGPDAGKPYKIGVVKDIFNTVYAISDPKNIISIEKDLFTKNLFTTRFNTNFDEVSQIGNLIKLGISDKDRKHFVKVFKNFYIDPCNFGIDAEAAQILDESSEILQDLRATKDLMFSDEPEEGTLEKKVLENIDWINKKALEYFQSAPKAKPVDDKDITLFLRNLGNMSLNSAPLRKDGSANPYYASGIEQLEFIAGKYPQYKPIFDEFKEKYNQRCEKDTKELYDNLAKTSVHDRKYDTLANKFTAMKDALLLDKKYAPKIDFIVMCKDSKARKELLKDIRPKERILASIVDYEFKCAEAHFAAEEGSRERAALPCSKALSNAFLGEAILNSEQVREIENYYDSLVESHAFKAILEEAENKGVAYQDKIIENGKAGELFFNRLYPVNSVGADALAALSQSSGNMYSANSEEYNNLKEALEDYESGMLAHDLAGASPDACRNLYKACTTYMYTHDSKPSSSNGKLRFNSAAKVMASLIPEMLEKCPDMKAQITKDVTVNMIRSKVFREAVKANAKEYGQLADQINKVLRDGIKVDMITGKLPTEELQNALLDRFGKEQGKMAQKKFEAKAESKGKKAPGLSNH